jgi:hypothetical protein
MSVSYRDHPKPFTEITSVAGGRAVAGVFVAGDGFVVVGALPVPYLSAGVAGVGEDRRDGPQSPGVTGAVAGEGMP